jgi:nucleoside-diphosphate-sugar epimerase
MPSSSAPTTTGSRPASPSSPPREVPSPSTPGPWGVIVPQIEEKEEVEEMIQPNWVCDITKAKTHLGFEPRIQLLQGAKLTFQWYKKENWL